MTPGWYKKNSQTCQIKDRKVDLNALRQSMLAGLAI